MEVIKVKDTDIQSALDMVKRQYGSDAMILEIRKKRKYVFGPTYYELLIGIEQSSAKGNLDKQEREQKAADRIFGLLPEEQGSELRKLWEEFDAMETPEAKYAAALDRLQPVLLNYLNKGGTWQEHDIKKEQVIKRIGQIEEGAPELWEFVSQLIEDAVAKGYLADK